MMRKKNGAPISAAALFLAITLVACGGVDGATPSESSEKLGIGTCVLPAGPLAVAISRRANNPGDIPAQVSQIVRKFITEIPAMVTGPTLSLINVDGRSDIYRTGQFYSDSRNKYGLESDQQQFLAGFGDAISEMRAVEPEVDILAALDEAGAAAGRPGPGTVVLVDSGLSTSGTLDFSQPNVLDAPADELVSFLRNGRQLPDLRGLTVIFVGIGEVARPQQKLGTRKAHLIELWTKIAEAGGAACAASVDVPRSDSPIDGDVKPVKLVPISPPPVYVSNGLTILPDAGEVGFKPGEAVFRDPAAVRAVLRPIADHIKANQSYRLLLTGTTARWGSREGQIDLAKRRAEAVKQELIGLGANPDQIETRGLGSFFPQYVPDNGVGDVLLPGPAQANRTVRIEPCDSACRSNP